MSTDDEHSYRSHDRDRIKQMNIDYCLIAITKKQDTDLLVHRINSSHINLPLL